MFLYDVGQTLCIQDSVCSSCAEHIKHTYKNWKKAKKGKNVEKLTWTMTDYRIKNMKSQAESV
jgi:hypothetical protein